MTELESYFNLLKFKNKRQFKNQTLNILRAPEPADIYWENLEYDFWFKLKKRIITFIGTLFVLGISFIIIYFLSAR